MKKTAAIIAIVALTATAAIAYPGGFRGQGGYGPCGGPGFGGQGQAGYGPCGGPGFGGPGFKGQAVSPVDDAGAKELVQTYLDTNLKGFKIVDTTKVEVPRGAMYSFEVKDANGNLFLFRVNPFGRLMGPVPAQQIK